MKVSSDQNEVCGFCMTTIFVEYNGELKCNKCVFADYSEHICDEIPCVPAERTDGKNGYYRQYGVNILDTPIPHLLKS